MVSCSTENSKNEKDEVEEKEVEKKLPGGKHEETVNWQLTGKNMVFGQEEVGFSMSYSVLSLIVDNSKNRRRNDTDGLHLFMLILTSSIHGIETGVRIRNDQNSFL